MKFLASHHAQLFCLCEYRTVSTNIGAGANISRMKVPVKIAGKI